MTTPSASSLLFTLRLWPEIRVGGGIAWRGKVTHVLSGEMRYFREWERLISFVEEAGGLAPPGQLPTDNSEAPGSDIDAA